jgi:hypothetical protein
MMGEEVGIYLSSHDGGDGKEEDGGELHFEKRDFGLEKRFVVVNCV